jgi:uncharacterized integral membrane protein
VTTKKLFAILILALLLIIIVLQNTAMVETRILFFSFQMPRALLLFIMTLVGFILGVLVSIRQKKSKDAEI